MDTTQVISITKPIPRAEYEEEDDNISDIDMDLLDQEVDEEENNNQQQTRKQSQDLTKNSIVTPGELITEDPIWMKGHGTYFIGDKTYSSVVGNISRVNRLLSVNPIRGKYLPETGDHIVGRITEVANKRWKVDIGSKQDAILMLGSVNLPGGILRRKSESDELQMRSFLKEGDLLNCEIQTIFNNGIASLHTRSLKYGKLRNGIFLKIPSSLIIKSKNHNYDLPGNVSVILGINGYIWLYKTKPKTTTNTTTINSNGSKLQSGNKDYTPGQGSISITRLEEESSWEIYSDKNDQIDLITRNNISRYYNSIKALAFCELGITEQRIIMAYEASLSFSNSGNLIDRDSMESLCREVLNNEEMRGNA
ncbi:rrp4 [Candida pseudojiufengensis]|uniref:rrp4 n=1 Tax=Candida pseudojiufengensis TaxID=497109 RepID=UPI0022257E71|nr:rrp4 [Candida pseudojiufengensis]KAI5965606.1 rrp4 [Candida pseudojiufengensis]